MNNSSVLCSLYGFNSVVWDFLQNFSIILPVFPINVYVIWLIATGAGNGLAAEFFSLNLSVCEILFCLECLCFLVCFAVEDFLLLGNVFDFLAINGRPVFQCLMCVERYLAVVHPVMFLKYKPLRYRILCCAVAWIACCVYSGADYLTLLFFSFEMFYCLISAPLCLFFIVQLFCLVAVLRALKQSGPGDKNKEEENQMKRRAFYLILITTIIVLVTYLPYIIVISLLNVIPRTVASICMVLFVLSGLVQPLFFLHRVKKIPFCKK